MFASGNMTCKPGNYKAYHGWTDQKGKTLTISNAKSVFASFASAVCGAANASLLFNKIVK
jgi:hypothetical protein